MRVFLWRENLFAAVFPWREILFPRVSNGGKVCVNTFVNSRKNFVNHWPLHQHRYWSRELTYEKTAPKLSHFGDSWLWSRMLFTRSHLSLLPASNPELSWRSSPPLRHHTESGSETIRRVFVWFLLSCRMEEYYRRSVSDETKSI